MALGRREDTERNFLALCIALPELGAPALAQLDLEQELSTPAIRRAAAHLREHLAAPTESPGDDDALAGLVRELAVRAASAGDASPATFEIERLQLALARLDREIAAARASGDGAVAGLASQRGTMQARLNQAMERAMRDGAAQS